MTCLPAATASSDGDVSDYETLRAQALAPAADTDSAAPGLLLLLGQGVPAWMARRSLGPGRPMPAPRTEARHLDQRHDDLVRILADMILATTRQVHP